MYTARYAKEYLGVYHLVCTFDGLLWVVIYLLRQKYFGFVSQDNSM